MTDQVDLPDIMTLMQPLIDVPNVTVAWSIRLCGGRLLEHRAHAPMEAGSSFKALVAAESCRQVERGRVLWTDDLVIRGEDRVDASEALENMPDGASVPLEEAVRVMLTYSDNTATDMLMEYIGRDRVLALVDELSLGDLHIPVSVKHIFAQSENDAHFAAFTTSMHDLRRFYDAVFEETLFARASTQERMLAYLRGEDASQGTDWPNGVICYRKSGSLVTDALVTQGIGGAFRRGQRVATFAMSANERPGLPAQAEATFEIFAKGLGAALKLVTGSLVDGRGQ